MPTITKAILTITSDYTAAPDNSPGTLDYGSWGCITLWDIRPWLPWDSRGLVGPGNWQDYLGRPGVMDSKQAPGYNPAPQAPKSWAKRTDTVTLYDSSLAPGGTHPFAECAVYGPGPYTTYTPDSISSVLSFDVSSAQNFADTLVLAVYAYNSAPPFFGGPTATDELNFYGAYVDVTFDTGATTRFYPQATVVIDPGPKVGSPTGVLHPSYAVDPDRDIDTAATVQETNGNNGLFSALWHPAVLLLENWSWGAAHCNAPPAGMIDQSYSHTFTVSGGTAPYTWSVVSGSLPPGLSLNASTGAVSGTPTVSGTYAFTLSVADASGIATTVSCSIRIRRPAGWLELWVWRVLSGVSSVEDTLEFPPGYDRALMLQLASEFGRQYPGHDLSKVKKKLAAAIAHIDAENVSNSQAVEELPPPAEQ